MKISRRTILTMNKVDFEVNANVPHTFTSGHQFAGLNL